MKRFFSLTVVAFLLLGTLNVFCVFALSPPSPPQPDTWGYYENLHYEVYDDVLIIDRCTEKPSGHLTIPETINGYPVKKIGSGAFDDCTELTGITLPKSLTEIGYEAFEGCTALTSFTLPANVTTVESNIFSGCDALTTLKVEKGHPVFTVKNNCLIDKEKKEIVAVGANPVIPTDGSVTSIGDRSFFGCRTITAFTVPSVVTEIGSQAFYLCDRLTSLTISASVKKIGSKAFYGCSSLASVTMQEGVESVWQGAFENCTALESIVLPNSVTVVSAYAFDGCEKLADIVFGENITLIDSSSISDTPYYNNSPLWQDGFLYIGKCLVRVDETVAGSVTVKDGIESISRGAFSGQEKITSVTLPSSVKTIAYNAFNGCTALRSVKLFEGLLEIQEKAFYGCESLEDVRFPDSVIYIEREVLDNTAFYADKKNWENYGLYCGEHLIDVNAKDIVVREGTRSISLNCFEDVYYPRERSITLPLSVTHIPLDFVRGNDLFDYPGALVTDVYYAGCEADRERIDFGDITSLVSLAETWHYAEPVDCDRHDEEEKSFLVWYLAGGFLVLVAVGAAVIVINRKNRKSES